MGAAAVRGVSLSSSQAPPELVPESRRPHTPRDPWPYRPGRARSRPVRTGSAEGAGTPTVTGTQTTGWPPAPLSARGAQHREAALSAPPGEGQDGSAG